MAGGRLLVRVAALTAAAALAACDGFPPAATAPGDIATSPVPPSRAVPGIDITPSVRSEELRLYYARLQNDLRARGLLRTDGGGPDTPYTDTILARNFVRIALFDEYVSDGRELRAQQTLSRLRRWEAPITLQVEFGAGVPEDQRAADRNAILAYAGRLSRITGHPIRPVAAGGNYHVLVLTEDDRLGFEDRLRAIVPGISDGTVRAFLNLDRSTLCLVMAFSSGGAPTYTQAVALIRAEHPDLLRLSCVHEELAQGMGLANDSPAARPSIFNDDEEFGLLTSHDELLLRMLYDPRLTPGMTAAEAAPIARQIAREMLEGRS